MSKLFTNQYDISFPHEKLIWWLKNQRKRYNQERMCTVDPFQSKILWWFSLELEETNNKTKMRYKNKITEELQFGSFTGLRLLESTNETENRKDWSPPPVLCECYWIWGSFVFFWILGDCNTGKGKKKKLYQLKNLRAFFPISYLGCVQPKEVWYWHKP